ncbi:c-type cytochrome [Rhodobacteraceae bacterium N5(2021)]|uniref:C-type cytochrome n=1 Tax=Gymnodinialimonas phycosphaerae TaxID=2841589 RepID=A0A975TZJ5_9RHOB|nr:c-type cytochrome [Gymnodinialimonas phycosphaerae]MBY4892894.1 c-type cytochrome [Gymnodinialimonas phycosphaerae]
MPSRSHILAGSLALVLSAAGAWAEGDPARGEMLYRPCAACHMIGEGAVNRIGPQLNGVVGRVVGTADGYEYSAPLAEAGVEGAVWSEAVLDRFLESPRDYLPGTSMVFRGIRSETDRTDLIAFLLQEGGPADTPAQISADTGPSPEIAAILAIEGDVAYGEYLSTECTACHRNSGGEDIPSIAGLAPSVFIMGLTAYRNGEREHQVMNMVTSRLGDEEIAALAAFFESASQ